MKKFILKLIKTIVLFYVVLFALQYLLDFYLAKENSCTNNVWYSIFEGKLNTDIVVLGNSRAEAHYNTEIITKTTSLKTYNFGINATTYNILMIKWKAFVNRNKKPKIVILDLDEASLIHSNTLPNKFQYLPYFNSKEYQDVAKEIDKDFYFEKLIPLYKYRGFEMKIIKQFKSQKDTLLCSNTKNGYIGHHQKWSDKDYKVFLKKIQEEKKNAIINLNIYSEGLKTIKEIILYCKNNNIKVYMIWSPSYIESHNYRLNYKKQLDSILQNVSKKFQIKYINFSNDSICLDKNYFYNSSHMNTRGVKKFSDKIGDLIKQNNY